MSAQLNPQSGNQQLGNQLSNQLNNQPLQHDPLAGFADEADAHRNAYNAAFHELGLSWYWDVQHYQAVQCRDGERACLRSYLERYQSHLLNAYDADFLMDAIEAAKQRCHAQLSSAGGKAGGYIDWARIQERHPGI